MNKVSESAKTVGIFQNTSNKKLVELFKSQGKIVFELPMLLPKKSDLKRDDLQMLQNLNTYDWIIFSDIWTVEVFFEILETLEFDLFDLDQLRICSNGEAVADSLRFRQIHSDVIPPKNSAKEVFTAISEYIFDERELSESSFLILKAKDRESELANLLRENAVDVVELEIYEIKNRKDSEFSKLKAMIYGGAVDEFVFNSPAEVFSLINIVGEENFAQLLSDVRIQAFDEITRQTLFEFDVKTEN